MSVNSYAMSREQEARDHNARVAAQLIYSSTGNDPHPLPPPMPPGHPHANIPNVATTGPPSDQNNFSSIRRLFCLMATFDLLLVAILWFIYIMLTRLGIKEGFYCQVGLYNFTTSLFDIVAVALFRMVVLLLAYALFKSKHWIWAVITTIATSGLVVAKIFLYVDFTSAEDYPENCQPKGSTVVMTIFLLICSVVLAWLELWMLDFRVLPKEKRELETMFDRNDVDERAPLIASNGIRSYNQGGGQQFYSPYDTPEDSDDSASINSEVSNSSFKSSRTADFQSLPNSQRGSTVDLAATAKEQEYIEKAKDSLRQLQGILDKGEIWKEVVSADEAVVYCGSYPGISQRLYKLDAILPVPVETMVELLWNKVDESASWNGALLEICRLQQINEFVDIVYSLAAPGGKGVFSSRDFVSVRLCEQRGERYVSSAIAVEHPDRPPRPEYVRGENGVSGWVLEPVPDRPDHCRYIWIINSNLKLKVWTPNNIMDPVMGGVILDSYKDLRNHLTQPREASVS
ncbi:stAR-related lipid transfer protein 3-like [Diadema setosum]|uniref:stAR-related lipid transfer protein 3-like n=1 Tax=Diadema setosum TaxID=31175 RepID=UPI003B3A5506